MNTVVAYVERNGCLKLYRGSLVILSMNCVKKMGANKAGERKRQKARRAKKCEDKKWAYKFRSLYKVVSCVYLSLESGCPLYFKEPGEGRTKINLPNPMPYRIACSWADKNW